MELLPPLCSILHLLLEPQVARCSVGTAELLIAAGSFAVGKNGWRPRRGVRFADEINEGGVAEQYAYELTEDEVAEKRAAYREQRKQRNQRRRRKRREAGSRKKASRITESRLAEDDACARRRAQSLALETGSLRE